MRKLLVVFLCLAMVSAFIFHMPALAIPSPSSPPVEIHGDFSGTGWVPVIIHFKQQVTFEIANMLDKTSFFKLKYGVDKEPYIFNIVNFHAIAGELYIPTGLNELMTSYSDLVKGIYEDHEVRAFLDTSVDYIKAPQVWDIGYKGAGEVIAIIDTGIDASHEDLDEGKVIGWKDFVNGKTTPYDDHGHGTHCASIAAGTGEASNGKYTGVAPEASLVGVKVLNSQGSGTESDVIAGIQWCVDNKDVYGIDIISMSLGVSQHCDGSCSVCQAADSAWDAGIFVAVAAGNDGPGRWTVGCPGNAWKVVTVGAIDDSSGSIASFSSRGPTLDTRLKPDICAPGVSITAADANTGDGYVTYSGTSMATPHVAGAAALLIDAYGGTAPPHLIKGAMISTAVDKGDPGPDIVYGWGVLDVYAAYQWIINPPSVSVKAAKIVYDDSLTEGDNTDVSVQLWSVGTSTASNVYIDDTLPSGFSLVSGSLDVSVGSLSPDAVYKNTYTIKADSAGDYYLGKAHVTWSGGDTYTNDVYVSVSSGGGICLGTALIVAVPIVGFITLKLRRKRK